MLKYEKSNLMEIVIFLSLLLIGCSSKMEKTETGNSIKIAAGPRLMVDTDTYDFGTISPGGVKKGIFILSNTGDKTLLIKDIEKCCGAVIELSKGEILPGQNAMLTAQYRAGQNSDFFSKNITIHTNDPENSKKMLTIKGRIAQTLQWSPKSFQIATFIRDINGPDITIKSLDGKSFSIQKIISSNQSVTADFDPQSKATEFTLKLKVDLNKMKTIKVSSGIVSIQLDHPDYPSISVSFQLIKPLQVSPSQIVVMKAKKGEVIEKTLEIHDNEAAANENVFQEIESITATQGAKIEVFKSENLESACKIFLNIQPAENEINELDSSVREELNIKMKDGRQLIVPVRIYYESPAQTTRAN